MPEPLLIGWQAIHKLFCDEEGNPAIPLSTFRQKYGPELKEFGIVFRFNPPPDRRPRVCCWPSKILNWWHLKQQQEWIEKNKPHVKPTV